MKKECVKVDLNTEMCNFEEGKQGNGDVEAETFDFQEQKMYPMLENNEEIPHPTAPVYSSVSELHYGGIEK